MSNSPYSGLSSVTRNTFINETSLEFRDSSNAASNTLVGLGVTGSNDAKLYTSSGGQCVLRNLQTGYTPDSAVNKGYVDDLLFGINNKGTVHYASKSSEDSGVPLPVTYSYNANTGEAFLISDGTMAWGQLTNGHVDIQHSTIADATNAGYFATNTPFVAHTHEFYSSAGGSSSTNSSEWPTRILVQNQSNQKHNGLYYLYQTTSPWKLKRLSKFDDAIANGEIRAGCFVFITSGHMYANRGYVLRTDAGKNVLKIQSQNAGDNISFTQFSGAQALSAGTNMVQTGSVMSLDSNISVSTAHIGAIDAGHTSNVNGLQLPTLSTTHASKTIYMSDTGLHSLGNITAKSLTSIDGFAAPSLAASSGTLSCGQGISPLFVANNSSVINDIRIGNSGKLKLVDSSGNANTTLSAADGEIKMIGSTLSCLGSDKSSQLLKISGAQDTVYVNGELKVGAAGSEALKVTPTAVNITGLVVTQDSPIVFQDTSLSNKFTVQTDKVKSHVPLESQSLDVGGTFSVSQAGSVQHIGTQAVSLLSDAYKFDSSNFLSQKTIRVNDGTDLRFVVDPVNKEVSTDKCVFSAKNGSTAVFKVAAETFATDVKGNFAVSSVDGTGCFTVNTSSPSVSTSAETTLNSRVRVTTSTDIAGPLHIRQNMSGAAITSIDPSAPSIITQGSVIVKSDASSTSVSNLTGSSLNVGSGCNINQTSATFGNKITLENSTGNVIASSCNIGDQLSVNSSGSLVNIPSSTSLRIRYNSTSDSVKVDSGGLHIYKTTKYISTTGAETGSITSESGEFRGSSFLTASDACLKHNISDVSSSNSGIALINKLRPVEFDWIEKGKPRQAGFIAQDIEQVLPEAVSKHEDIMYVDQTKIIVHLVKAVQELSSKIEDRT